jgi:hypothetical protein
MEDFFDLENYVNVVRSKIQTMLDKLEEAKNLNQQLDQVSLFRNDDYDLDLTCHGRIFCPIRDHTG